MSNIVTISVVVPFILFMICVTSSLVLAQRRNAELHARSPESMPYTWGFFLGYSGIIGAMLVYATAGVMTLAGLYQDWFPLVLAYAVILGIASYGVLMRHKWGWLFHIPLTLNPGLWAFNSIYVSNRWREFPWH